MSRCEDWPCCGHTNEDPCGPQWYDEPGAFDTSRPGNEHALCDHMNGECDVDEPEDECADCAADPEGICAEHDAKAEDAYQADTAISPMEDIPWGTPDEWIPDNPDENGMRQSDFV